MSKLPFLGRGQIALAQVHEVLSHMAITHPVTHVHYRISAVIFNIPRVLSHLSPHFPPGASGQSLFFHLIDLDLGSDLPKSTWQVFQGT